MFDLVDPLHPAVVHLPIALALVIPMLALLGALTIHRGGMPVRTWLAVVLLQVVLVGSGWMALETGEEQEERVERIVPERYIEEHEELAERFQIAAGIALAIIAAGILPGVAGGIARGVSVVAAFAVLATVVQVGHTGGELVYRHGAANAYSSQDAPGLAAGHGREHQHDSDDD